MLKINIIGCGKVAKTLAYLWHQTSALKIGDVVNRTQTSAEKSVAFIGAGNPISTMANITKADVFVIACGDDDIESCLDELIEQDVIEADTIVFHFSGAKPASVLNKAKKIGAQCASMHPVKSFAKPSTAIKTFDNTYCCLEGDNAACEKLKSIIETIGGHCFTVKSENKLIYHAASVFACNYLVALQELSIKAFEKSGVERDLAMKILEPIVKETTNNVFELGTANALTGPIKRGDVKLVSEQYNALQHWDNDAADVYKLLGKLSVELLNNKSSSGLTSTNLTNISELFSK